VVVMAEEDNSSSVPLPLSLSSVIDNAVLEDDPRHVDESDVDNDPSVMVHDEDDETVPQSPVPSNPVSDDVKMNVVEVIDLTVVTDDVNDDVSDEEGVIPSLPPKQFKRSSDSIDSRSTLAYLFAIEVLMTDKADHY